MPILSDGVLTDTLTRTHYITASPPLVADFAADPLTGTLPLTVTFTNLSTPTQFISGYVWVYGDGISRTTSTLTHTHPYTRAGVYTVSLTADAGRAGKIP
jgi:PKD repeat protein